MANGQYFNGNLRKILIGAGTLLLTGAITSNFAMYQKVSQMTVEVKALKDQVSRLDLRINRLEDQWLDGPSGR